MRWGFCFWKMKFIVPMFDFGVGKEFHIKEIVACGGGGFEIKNYSTMYDPLLEVMNMALMKLLRGG